MDDKIFALRYWLEDEKQFIYFDLVNGYYKLYETTIIPITPPVIDLDKIERMVDTNFKEPVYENDYASIQYENRTYTFDTADWESETGEIVGVVGMSPSGGLYVKNSQGVFYPRDYIYEDTDVFVVHGSIHDFCPGDKVTCKLCVHHPYAFEGEREIKKVEDFHCLIDDAWYGFNTLNKARR